jgi:hypothetical protein
MGYLSDHTPIRFVILFSGLGSAACVLLLWGLAGHDATVLVTFCVVFGLIGLSFAAVWAKLTTIICSDYSSRLQSPLLLPIPSLQLLLILPFTLAEDERGSPSFVLSLIFASKGGESPTSSLSSLIPLPYPQSSGSLCISRVHHLGSHLIGPALFELVRVREVLVRREELCQSPFLLRSLRRFQMATDLTMLWVVFPQGALLLYSGMTMVGGSLVGMCFRE